VFYIVLPGLRYLIIVQFIGAVIGAFKGGVEMIMVMTGGGPNNATHILALEIFTRVFLDLRFGPGTAMAWILGRAAHGFTAVPVEDARLGRVPRGRGGGEITCRSFRELRPRASAGASCYAILFVCAGRRRLTMVYPFAIMVSGSLRTPLDQPDMDLIPRFLVDRDTLYRKFLETKYNLDVAKMNAAHGEGNFTFKTSRCRRSSSRGRWRISTRSYANRTFRNTGRFSAEC
jgi:hypothetical protein